MKTPIAFLSRLLLLVAASGLAMAGPQVVGWGRDSAPYTPTPIAISGGDGFSLVLDADGTVKQTGNPFGDPVPVPADLGSAISISAGDNVAIALRTDRTVRVWRVWGGTSGPLPSGLTNIVAVSAGYETFVALKADGTVKCWGRLTEPPGLSNIVAVAAESHVVVLKSDGGVVCWGSQPEVTNVPPGLTNAIAISAGVGFTVALKADGTVVAWGDNPFGALDVPASLTGVVAISAENSGHVLALKQDGTVVAWGRNSDGQCNVPQGLRNVVAIATSSSSSMVITDDSPNQPQNQIAGAWEGDHFVLRYPTQSRRVYQVESTDSIDDVRWTAGTLESGNGKVQTFHDFANPTSHRLYRVRQW